MIFFIIMESSVFGVKSVLRHPQKSSQDETSSEISVYAKATQLWRWMAIFFARAPLVVLVTNIRYGGGYGYVQQIKNKTSLQDSKLYYTII